MRYDDRRLGEDYDCYSIPLSYVYNGMRYEIMNYGGPQYKYTKVESYFWLTIGNLNLSSTRVIKIYMTKPEYVRKSRKDDFNMLRRDELDAMITFLKSKPSDDIEDLHSCCLKEYSRICNRSWNNMWEYFLDKINSEEGFIAMPINLPIPDYTKLPTKSF